jgi:hypothetical protein
MTLNAARKATDDRNLIPSIPIDAARLTDETNRSAVPELIDETTRSRIRIPQIHRPFITAQQVGQWVADSSTLQSYASLIISSNIYILSIGL